MRSAAAHRHRPSARRGAAQPLVLDEPVSALDVSVRAGDVNLLEELQERLGLTYVFLSHDLAVLRHVAHRAAVMYLGKIVEIGTRDDVFDRPSHPYTQALLSAIPIPNPDRKVSRRRIVLSGDRRVRSGPVRGGPPELVDRGQGHPVACHFAESVQIV